MAKNNYKEIPSVQEVLQNLASDISVHENLIVKLVRSELADYRDLAKSGKLKMDRDEIVTKIAETVLKNTASTIKNIINGTGIVLHTNFGRAPISKELFKKLSNKLYGYTNLEVNVQTGKRANRLDHLSNLMGAITNTEGSVIVNNNAAAVMLALNTFAEGKEVIVSRGQEVEIGGSFRIPDIVKKSNCKLVEVGTTNRTHLKDYERAINKNTALLLWVHTSNYVVKGFTKDVQLSELKELAKRKRIPFLADLGSGAILDLASHGLPNEIPVEEVVSSGVDIITFSGDKLLGGPQSGIIVGKNKYLKRIRNNPLYRALRCDKMTITLLDEVLRTYTKNFVSKNNLANMLLMRSPNILRKNAEKVLDQIQPKVVNKWKIKIVDSMVEAGSGSLPERNINSIALQFNKDNSQLQDLSAKLRNRDVPIFGYINRGKFYIDLRAVLNEQLTEIAKAINEV